jgi:hypothetical protein
MRRQVRRTVVNFIWCAAASMYASRPAFASRAAALLRARCRFRRAQHCCMCARSCTAAAPAASARRPAIWCTRYSTVQSIAWEEPPVTGQAPCPRSGHTLTGVGGKFFLFGGNGRVDGALEGAACMVHRSLLLVFVMFVCWKACIFFDSMHVVTCRSHPPPVYEFTPQASHRRSTTCLSSTPAAQTSTNGGRLHAQTHRLQDLAMQPLR